MAQNPYEQRERRPIKDVIEDAIVEELVNVGIGGEMQTSGGMVETMAKKAPEGQSVIGGDIASRQEEVLKKVYDKIAKRKGGDILTDEQKSNIYNAWAKIMRDIFTIGVNPRVELKSLSSETISHLGPEVMDSIRNVSQGVLLLADKYGDFKILSEEMKKDVDDSLSKLINGIIVALETSQRRSVGITEKDRAWIADLIMPKVKETMSEMRGDGINRSAESILSELREVLKRYNKSK